MKVDKEITEEYGKGPRVTYILSDKRALTTKNQKKPEKFGTIEKGFRRHKCSNRGCDLWAIDCWENEGIQRYGCPWHSIWS